jgi:hypothetical protein
MLEGGDSLVPGLQLDERHRLYVYGQSHERLLEGRRFDSIRSGDAGRTGHADAGGSRDSNPGCAPNAS